MMKTEITSSYNYVYTIKEAVETKCQLKFKRIIKEVKYAKDCEQDGVKVHIPNHLMVC